MIITELLICMIYIGTDEPLTLIEAACGKQTEYLTLYNCLGIGLLYRVTI